MGETVFAERRWISAQASYASQRDRLAAMVGRLSDQLSRLALDTPRRVAMVGIGASHAAAAGAVHELRRNGFDAVRFLPSELPSGLRDLDGLKILISQSGRSIEIVELAREVDAADVIALTNYAPSPLGVACGRELNLGDLPDSSVSFVSFVGTMIALALLTDRWCGRTRVEHWTRLVAETFEAVERHDAVLREQAAMLAGGCSVDIVAPAPLMSVAEEAALMFREGPRLFATATETRQYLHGAMDAAGPGAHLVFGGRREAMLIDQLSQRTQRLAFVTDHDGAGHVRAASALVLPASLADPMSFAVAATVLAQKLTLHAAALRSVDIDEAAFQRLDTKTDRSPAP